MSEEDPIALLFGGLAQQGPGSDADTLAVLRRLPRRTFGRIVDAGCGAGRQTMALAGELGTVVHALDTHRPFLDDLAARARAAGRAHLIATHCRSMSEIPALFSAIDLLWSEGAAYNIGFGNALATWASALAPTGLLVVSELSWLTEENEAPAVVREFFRSAYPDMCTHGHNIATAEDVGYRVLFTHTLPATAWTRGYYDQLGPRARTLLVHSSPAVQTLAQETLREIEIFHLAHGCYGYVFYALARAPATASTRPARCGRSSATIPSRRHRRGTSERTRPPRRCSITPKLQRAAAPR